MHKILDKYRAEPSPKTAAAVVRYLAKHPMAACLLSEADVATVKAAELHA